MNKFKIKFFLLSVFCLIFCYLLFFNLAYYNVKMPTSYREVEYNRTIKDDEEKSYLLDNSCNFPVLTAFEPNLINHVALYGPTICKAELPNIAKITSDNKLVVFHELEPSKRKQTPPFECTYQAITGALRGNTSDFQFDGNPIKVDVDRPLAVNSSNFYVRCINRTQIASLNGKPIFNGTGVYESPFAAFPNYTEKIKVAPLATPKNPSLTILVLDSVARNQFLRHMPETTQFMKELGFIFLEGYTKVGDNSAVNLLPVLAGRSILPQVGGDGRELLDNNTRISLEAIPFLWDFMKQKKCITMFNDDILNVKRGLFHYPQPTFEGFEKAPTDYYFRPYHLFNTKRMVSPGSQCMKTGKVNAQEYLDIYRRFSVLFKESCHFSFNFLTGLTHDDSSNLNAIDTPLRRTLESFVANNVTQNTVMVVMGDHGNRIGAIQATYAGRIEERMPLFSIFLPQSFKNQYPHLINNLLYNAKRLVSNYDVHQTLKDIALGNFDTVNRNVNSNTRGTSLLRFKVPKNRTCTEAGVPENFCICMNERNSTKYGKSSLVYNAVQKLVVDYVKDVCGQKADIKFLSDELHPLELNQMVRHGLRDAVDYPKIAGVQAAMEVVYFNININMDHQSAQKYIAHFRIKHYMKENTLRIVSTPFVTINDVTMPLEVACTKQITPAS